MKLTYIEKERVVEILNEIILRTGDSIMDISKKTTLSRATFYRILDPKNKSDVRFSVAFTLAKNYGYTIEISKEEEVVFSIPKKEVKEYSLKEFATSNGLKEVVESYAMMGVATKYGITDANQLEKALSVFLKKSK